VASVLASVTAVRIFTSFFPIFDKTFFEIAATFLIYSALVIPKTVFWGKKSYKREKETVTP